MNDILKSIKWIDCEELYLKDSNYYFQDLSNWAMNRVTNEIKIDEDLTIYYSTFEYKKEFRYFNLTPALRIKPNNEYKYLIKTKTKLGLDTFDLYKKSINLNYNLNRLNTVINGLNTDLGLNINPTKMLYKSFDAPWFHHYNDTIYLLLNKEWDLTNGENWGFIQNYII